MHEAKYKEKVLELFSHQQADQHRPTIFLVWTTIVDQLMTLHYRLFNYGTWFNHIEPSPDAEQQRLGIFHFCRKPTANPAAKMITAFAAMLVDADGAGKEFMPLTERKYGSMASWPRELSKMLHNALVIAMLRAWRLIWQHFQQWPWLLAPVYDPHSTAEDQSAAIARFLAIPPESPILDAGLGRKLRSLVSTPEDMLEPQLFHFMQTLFSRLVVTSTFVERLFKDLTCWTHRANQTVATVAAKHVNAEFSKDVKRWRQRTDAATTSIPGAVLNFKEHSDTDFVQSLTHHVNHDIHKAVRLHSFMIYVRSTDWNTQPNSFRVRRH